MAPVWIAVISATSIFGGSAAMDHLPDSTHVDVKGCSANHINMTSNDVDCSTVGPMVARMEGGKIVPLKGTSTSGAIVPLDSAASL
ncbi:hypothetical protein ABK933_03640 [Klebsiella aerogenes]|uniref:hypothetical protein n=1 Tax=Klebsiella aerogenes TaxID=548 RepID=UPI0037529210